MANISRAVDIGDILKYINMTFAFATATYGVIWSNQIVKTRIAMRFARRVLSRLTAKDIGQASARDVLRFIKRKVRFIRMLMRKSESHHGTHLKDLRIELISAYLLRPDIQMSKADFVQLLAELGPKLREPLFAISDRELGRQIDEQVAQSPVSLGKASINIRYAENFKELKTLANT